MTFVTNKKTDIIIYSFTFLFPYKFIHDRKVDLLSYTSVDLMVKLRVSLYNEHLEY